MNLLVRREWELPQSRVKLLQPHVAFGAIIVPIVLGVLGTYLTKKGDSTSLGVGFGVAVAVILLLIVAAFIDGAIRHFRENRNLRALLAANPSSEKIGPPRDDWMCAGLALVFFGGIFVMFLTLIATLGDDREIRFWFGVPVATIASVSLGFGFGRIERYVVVSRAYFKARALEDGTHRLSEPERPKFWHVLVGLLFWLAPPVKIAVISISHKINGGFIAMAVAEEILCFFMGLGAMGVYLNAREKWLRWQLARAAAWGVEPPNHVEVLRGMLLLVFSCAALAAAFPFAMNEYRPATSTLFVVFAFLFALAAERKLAKYVDDRRKFIVASA